MVRSSSAYITFMIFTENSKKMETVIEKLYHSKV